MVCSVYSFSIITGLVVVGNRAAVAVRRQARYVISSRNRRSLDSDMPPDST